MLSAMQPVMAGTTFVTSAPHVPALQVAVALQALPHVPQLATSVVASVHIFAHTFGVSDWHAQAPLRLKAPVTQVPSGFVAAGSAPAAPVEPPAAVPPAPAVPVAGLDLLPHAAKLVARATQPT